MRKEKLEELDSYLEELKTVKQVRKDPSFLTRLFRGKGFLSSDVYAYNPVINKYGFLTTHILLTTIYLQPNL